MKKSLGEKLKKLRKKNKLSQAEVAKQINISRQAYSHYETGHTCPPTETLRTLAELYSTSVEHLLSCSVNENSVPYVLTDEVKLIFLFRSMNARQKDALVHYAYYISDRPE